MDAAAPHLLTSAILEARTAASVAHVALVRAELAMSQARAAGAEAEAAARRVYDLTVKLGPAPPAVSSDRVVALAAARIAPPPEVLMAMAEVQRRTAKALWTAIPLDRVDAITRASVDDLLAIDEEGRPALHLIMTRKAGRPYLDMLNAWRGVLVCNGWSADRIADLINEPRLCKMGIENYVLIWACRLKECSVDVVQWLVDHGADVNVRDGNLCTPLYALITARYEHSETDSIRILNALRSKPGALRMDMTWLNMLPCEAALAEGKKALHEALMLL
jgi:hypothetical protein